MSVGMAADNDAAAGARWRAKPPNCRRPHVPRRHLGQKRTDWEQLCLRVTLEQCPLASCANPTYRCRCRNLCASVFWTPSRRCGASVDGCGILPMRVKGPALERDSASDRGAGVSARRRLCRPCMRALVPVVSRCSAARSVIPPAALFSSLLRASGPS